MPPFVCTRNSLHHLDYGIPIVCNKSTDYRTSTGSFHGLVPENPQEFDCRVKINLRPNLRTKNVALKECGYNSSYDLDYTKKHIHQIAYRKAAGGLKDFSRNVQEKMFAEPPVPLIPRLSEMKDSFRTVYFNPTLRELYPPAISGICPIRALGRDEQPPVRPECEGFWKWLDPYMTTNQVMHKCFSKEEREKAREDVATYYNVSGKHKGFNDALPPASGNKTVFEKTLMKYQLPNRLLRPIVHRVPNFGCSSEYNAEYVINSRSDLAPYIHTPGEDFDESLSGASAWQNLAPVGMYCTDYCHIGTGYPVRSVVKIDKEKKGNFHDPCCTKFTDDHK